MVSARLEAYIRGWTQVCNSNPRSVADMIEGAHPDLRFSDVNSPNVHVGHDGIREICRLATALYDGSTIILEALLTDGQNWSSRWTMNGHKSDGTVFTRRGASAGVLSSDGRVIEHTDYWSREGDL